MKFVLDMMAAQAAAIGKNLGAQAFLHRRGIGVFSAGVAGGVLYGNVASSENHPKVSGWSNVVALSLAACGIITAVKRFPEARNLILLAGTGFELSAATTLHLNHKHASRRLELKTDIERLVDLRIDERISIFKAEAEARANTQAQSAGTSLRLS
jgi:hypothetical protein